MDRLTALSLRQRALIALVTLAIGLFGVISMSSLKQELFPSLQLPVVSVTAEYPGAAPDVVDADVAQPIEAAMQGLEGLESTTSTSTAGVASVAVSFAYGTDLVYAEQRIGQALGRIDAQLPEGVETNVLSGSIGDFPIMQLAVTGGDREATAERIRSQTIPDLLKIDGVRDATLSGAPERRVAITLDQEKLAAAGLTAQSIRDALDTAGILIPIGQITEGDQTLTVQAGSVLASAADVAAIPVQGAANPLTGAPGAPTTIGAVATVALEDKPVTTISRVNGVEALTIAITKTPRSNTVDVSQAVRAELGTLRDDLGEGVELESVFDQAPFVEQSIETLIVEGLLGLAFAVVVIWVFLRSFRSTLVTAISIPASLLVTFIGLQAAQYSLNILTLGALTIAIGRVVDDSIVVIENIRRHLGEEGEPRPERRRAIILEAVREVAGAVTSSTIATVAVYLPIAFVGDIAGELFRPFALTSVIALLASLVVSLTIVPVLAYWFLGGRARRSSGAAAGALAARPADAEAGADAAVATAIADADADADAAADPASAPASVGARLAGAAADGASAAGPSERGLRWRPKQQRAERDRARFAPLGLRDEEPAELAEADPTEPARFADGLPGAVSEAVPAPAALASAAGSETGADSEAALDPADRMLLDADPASLTRRELRRREELLAERSAEAAERAETAEPRELDVAPMAAGMHQSGGGPLPVMDPAQDPEAEDAERVDAPQDEEPADGPAHEAATVPAGVAASVAAPSPAAATHPAATSHPAAVDPAAHPALAAALGHDERPDGWLQRAYVPLLGWTLRRPGLTLLGALLVLVLTGALAPLMSTNFLGSAGSPTVTITQTLAPNASLAAVDAATKDVERAIVDEPGVKTVQLTYGGSSIFSLFSGQSSSVRYSVTVEDGAEVSEVQAALEEKLGAIPDAGEIAIGQQGGAGFSEDLEIDLDAPTTGALADASDAVLAALDGRAGIVSASSSLGETRPYVRIDIDRTAAAAAGLSEVAIGGIVAQQLSASPLGEVMVDGSAVKVELVPASPPTTVDAIRAISIPSAGGPQPLSSYATVEIVDGPVQITAERGTPTATITVVPDGENLSASNAAIEAALADAELPIGAHAALGGVSANQAESFQQLGLALLAAILIVYIVMVATFRSLLQPLLLLISVPFAATGAILLLIATGVPLGLPSLIGVLMLVGIVVTNAIVLIDLVNQFRERGMTVAQALVEGGARRVRPIIMTALATILALTPMALGITGHGGFISQPLAIVVIGGLLSSTLLTLVVLPALYKAVEAPRERRAARRAAELDADLATRRETAAAGA